MKSTSLLCHWSLCDMYYVSCHKNCHIHYDMFVTMCVTLIINIVTCILQCVWHLSCVLSHKLHTYCHIHANVSDNVCDTCHICTLSHMYIVTYVDKRNMYICTLSLMYIVTYMVLFNSCGFIDVSGAFDFWQIWTLAPFCLMSVV